MTLGKAYCDNGRIIIPAPVIADVIICVNVTGIAVVADLSADITIRAEALSFVRRLAQTIYFDSVGVDISHLVILLYIDYFDDSIIWYMLAIYNGQCTQRFGRI